MKRNLLYIFAVVIISVTSCKVDSPDFRGYDIIDAKESYLPFTKGSIWVYDRYLSDIGQDSTTGISVNNAVQFGNRYYHKIQTSGRLPIYVNTYYGYSDHQYFYKTTSDIDSLNMDMLILVDTASKGSRWSIRYTETGYIKGYPARVLGTLKDKDVTREVLGKLYSGVVHTQIELQTDSLKGTGFATTAAYDFYLVKGVGIIQADLQSHNYLISVTKLISADIK